MGREWYPWGAKSSKRRAAKGGAKSSVATVKPEPPPPPPEVVGCMGVVSHLLDFHPLHFCLHHPESHHQSPFGPSQDGLSSLKGFEAPRNSLETGAMVGIGTASLASISEAEQEPDQDLYIPMGIQINTGRRDTRLLRSSQSPTPKLVCQDDSFSFSEPETSNTPPIGTTRRDTKLLRVRAPRPETREKQSSSNLPTESTISPAGPRTPTLVARLMGLDLLPEGCPSSSNCTPRSSITTPHRPSSHSATPKMKKSNKSPTTSVNGRGAYDFSGSLMETPRLSLQLNKENRGAKEGFVELSRHSCSEINTKRRDFNWKGGEEEGMISRSPGYYARQIMKQVKDSVMMRRKFGSDITNKTREVQSRDVRKENKRPPQTANVDVAKKESPRKSVSPLSPIREQRKEAAPPAVKVEEPMEIAKPENHQEKAAVKKDWRARNPGPEKKGANPCAKRSPQMNKKEEQFVRAGAVATTRVNQGSEKKCKATPLSSELLQGRGVPSLGPLKKSDPSIPAASGRKVAQEQNKAKPRPTTLPAPASASSRASSAAPARSEFNHISQILRRAGINRDTPVSAFTRWFSPSRPLDPSLFHFMEAESRPVTGADELSPACNRRLMFDLVDEILAQIMRPKKVGRAGAGGAGPGGWARMHGFQVTRMVWTRVKEFPRADCKILQDIDELVEMDLSGQGMDAGFVAREEEEDDIVAVIGREIVEALVADTVVAVRAGGDNGYFLTGRPD